MSEFLNLEGLSHFLSKIYSTTKKYVDDTVQSAIENVSGSVLTGSIFWYTSTTIPDGYLSCDGSAISRTTYANLFSVIGATFGSGDGSTTFNIPDLRASFIRGSGAVNGYSATFGIKQMATTLNLMYNPNTNITELSANYFDMQTTDMINQGEIPARSGRSTTIYSVRPYNIALTPIIKY